MLEDYIGERVYLKLCGLHTHRPRNRPSAHFCASSERVSLTKCVTFQTLNGCRLNLICEVYTEVY